MVVFVCKWSSCLSFEKFRLIMSSCLSVCLSSLSSYFVLCCDIMCVRENRTISHIWILITQQFEGPPSPFFSELLHRNTLYEKRAWSLQHDAPFPGRVPVKTAHSARSHNAWKKNFLGACLNGVFSKVCGPIFVKLSGFVEMDTLSQSADICSNLPTPLCAIRG